MNQDSSDCVGASRGGSADRMADIAPGDPVGEVLRAAFARAAMTLLAQEAAARPGDAEAIHRMRTESRRLRSELRAFEELREAGGADPLEAEMRWLGEVLGEARDLHVLREGLGRSGGGLRDDLAPLFAELDARHETALADVREALDSGRYRALNERLALAADDPGLSEAAEEPCRSALPRLVAGAWRKLKKAGRRLKPDDPDDEFHAVRKRAKRARHAAEAASAALDPPAAKAAKRFARRAHQIQEILGRHQDAVVACREIDSFVAGNPPAGRFLFAAGRLLERQAKAALDARSEFLEAWKRLDRKKVTRWMD
jgi:CHAD domain-containing protein